MAHNQVSLSEDFELRGLFYLPDAEVHKVPGTLSYRNDDGIRLTLDGRVGPEDPPSSDFRGLVGVVLAEFVDGRLGAVTNVFEESYQLNLFQGDPYGCRSSELTGQRLFLGHSLVDPCVSCFESLALELTDFGAWVGRDPFREEARAGSVHGRHSYTLVYDQPSRIVFQLDDIGAEIAITSRISQNNSFQARRQTHTDFLEIKSLEPKPFEWYFELSERIRSLLSLLNGRATYYERIQCCVSAERIGEGDEALWKREYVDLIQRHGAATVRRKRLNPFEVPFSLKRIEAEFGGVIKSWFASSNQLRNVQSLFFGNLLGEGVPLEFQFLSLIQALEAYHRTSTENCYLGAEEYVRVRQQLTNSIPEDVPKGLRESLKSRIKFGNEYSLRKRLNVCINTLHADVKQLVLKGDKDFVEKVVLTRNYLTHRDEGQRSCIMSSKETMETILQLRLLLHYLLLLDTGLPRHLIAEVLGNHPRFRANVISF